MNYKKIAGWLTVDMLVFAFLNMFLLVYFKDRFYVLYTMGYFQLIVLGLAAYRAANIVSNEVITKPLRAPFVNETKDHGKIVEKPKSSGFAGAFGLLIYCPSCTGVWLSAVIIYSYVFWPTPTFVVTLFLALSAMERIIARLLAFFTKD